MQGNSDSSYLTVFVINDAGNRLSSWDIDTLSYPVNFFYPKPDPPPSDDPPPIECCQILSFSQLTQKCGNPGFALQVYERGLQWRQSYFNTFINYKVEKIVNGTYNVVFHEDRRSTLHGDETSCSHPIGKFATGLFWPSGSNNLPCGNYRVTYTKGFYLVSDQSRWECSEDIDELIQHQP